jgi:hypothetical protein
MNREHSMVKVILLVLKLLFFEVIDRLVKEFRCNEYQSCDMLESVTVHEISSILSLFSIAY